MRRNKGFTLIELLVVISIIALLMAILMPVLGRVKRMARAVVCQSNLRQWGVWYSMYTNDNDGLFFKNYFRPGGASYWYETMLPYYEDCNDLLLCPMAAKYKAEPSYGERILGSKLSAWHIGQSYPGSPYPRVYGSYGLNKYISNDSHESDGGGSGSFWYWRTTSAKGADKIPVFFDCRRWEVYTMRRILPPDYDDMLIPSGTQSMPLVCIDRHDGHINSLFLDFSVRKVGLKELWTLNWHRGWDTANEWTRAGGVKPEDWPEWMRKFKDY